MALNAQPFAASVRGCAVIRDYFRDGDLFPFPPPCSMVRALDQEIAEEIGGRGDLHEGKVWGGKESSYMPSPPLPLSSPLPENCAVKLCFGFFLFFFFSLSSFPSPLSLSGNVRVLRSGIRNE